MEYWTESLLIFMKERWVLIILAIAAAILIIKVLQTIFKWLIVAAIIFALVYYGLQYSEQLQDVTNRIKNYTLSEWKEWMEIETESAQYEQHADGSYVIQSKNVKLEGTEHSDTVKITIKGKSFTIKKNEVIESYMEQVKQKAGYSSQ